MYVTNARHTVAIDVATGRQIWRHTLDWPPETPRVVCCGVSNKGPAILNGKVFRTTLDAQLHHHLPLDAIDIDVAQDHSPVGVPVVHLVRRELVIPDEFAGLGPHRKQRSGVQVVARSRGRIPRAGVARAPIDKIEIGVVRAGDPGRAAAAQVGVSRRPGLIALLTRSGDGVAAPELLSSFRIPTVEKTADAELGAGDAGDQHAGRDLRRHCHREALFPLRNFLLPDLLAGLHVERDNVGIEGGAENLAVENRRTLIGYTAAYHPWRLERPVE